MIHNPYCVVPNKHDKGYTVSFRYMIANKVKYNGICSCSDAKNARNIANLLNEHREIFYENSLDKDVKTA